MDWKSLFFGFDGRIGRKTWWLASIFLVSSGMVLTLLVNPKSWMGAPPNVADTLVSLAMIIPETAVSVKRFNDRGWPQWMPYGLASMGVIFTVLLHFDLVLTSNPPTLPDILLLGAVLSALTFVIFDNGFLRGTRGENVNGPDPLDSSTAGTPASKKNANAA